MQCHVHSIPRTSFSSAPKKTKTVSVRPVQYSVQVPLTDMSQAQDYKGEDGGLYGGDRNHPPQQHLDAALAASKLIRPLCPAGQPSVEGLIGIVSIGPSNAEWEFEEFTRLATTAPQTAASLRFANGAQMKMHAAAWSNTPPNRPPWLTLNKRVAQSGLTMEQVQVAWVKHALWRPARYGEFPWHAEALKNHVATTVQRLKVCCPNLRLAYLSSRVYAGYANSELNPEPYAYESAFAIRWLIQAQVHGDISLIHDAFDGPVMAPVLLWGPYLWANGAEGRKRDRLVWARRDFKHDGIHLSKLGNAKIAKLLMRFFATDQTARIWFLKGSSDLQGEKACQSNIDSPCE